MPLVPGQVIHGRYRVIALLSSQGGMSAVYEVMDNTLNIRCALKEMLPYPGTSGSALPELREQFQQEARLLASLRHPNLPRVSDHFEEDGNAYLVMDFIYGRRLDEVVAQEGGLTEDEVLDWARQLIEALAHCHERDVIHRDVKPQNVIITWQGQAILVDFGLAKLVDPKDPHTRTVMRGLGTPEYAPPEQYDTKKGGTDPRTDIYSLSATLYHALAGVPPPTATERVVDPEILVPVRERRDDVSEVTDQVLMKAMALRPAYRFQSVAEMYQALFGSPLPTQAKAESIAPSAMDTTLLVEPSKSNVFLPWRGARGLRIDRRLGVGLLAVALVSLVTIISLLAGQVRGGSVPTATATATATPTVRVTMTATHTPTATPSPTATSTPSPTQRPPTRQPSGTPEGNVDSRPFVVTATATPTATPTRVFIPSPTSTPMPAPTSTSKPESSRPTDIPPPTPEPTEKPPEPTEKPTEPPPEPTTIRTPPGPGPTAETPQG
jgi:serine/threonine protein kinase